MTTGLLLGMSVFGGGVNPNTDTLNPIFNRSTLLTDCYDCSAGQLNLDLWKTFRRYAKDNPAQAINFLQLPKDVFDCISQASDIQLGRITANFLCSFKPKKSEIHLIYQILDQKKEAPIAKSDPQTLFHHLYWLEVWKMAASTPLRTLLMFELPMDMIKRIGLLTSSQLFEFIHAVYNIRFELRFNPYIVKMLANGYSQPVIKFIQLIQSLGRDDVIQNTLSKKNELSGFAILGMLDQGLTAQDIADHFGISYTEVILMIKQTNSYKNLPTYNQKDVDVQLEFVRRDKVESLSYFGLHNPLICELTHTTNSIVRTAKDRMIARKMVPNFPPSVFYQPYKAKKSTPRLAYAIASLYLSIYHLIGSESIYRSVNDEAMMYAYNLAYKMFTSHFFSKLNLPFFHPSDAYFWAKALREARGKFEFCPQCGCLYPVQIDDSKLKKSQLAPCPFCFLINTKLRKQNKEVLQQLQPISLPI